MWSYLWYSLRGYVRIRIKGKHAALFLDRAGKAGITIRNIKKDGEDSLFDVRPDEFRKLRAIEGSREYHFSVEEKKSLLLFAMKFRHRPMLAIGFVLALLVVWGMSTRISAIEVTGCYEVDQTEILRAIADVGAEEGAPIASVDTEEVSRAVSMKVKGISKTAVTMNATRLIIEVVESQQGPEMLDDGAPCNIIADKEGIVREIYVYEGEAAVKAGDAVQIGDTLVSGHMPAEFVEGIGRYVHSRADISVGRWYTGIACVSNTVSQWKLTGREETADYIAIGPIDSTERSAFAEYEQDRMPQYSLEGFFLPVTIGTEHRRELICSQVARAESDSQALAAEAAWERAVAQIPENARIVGHSTTFTNTQNGVAAITVIETVEPIGRRAAIIQKDEP